MACEKLAKTKDPAVIPELAKALHNRPVEVRAAAARSLGELGHPSAVPSLVRALADSDVMVSTAAADALGEIRDASAVPALRQVLHNYRTSKNRHEQIYGDNRGLYTAAVYALKRIDSRDARPRLPTMTAGD
jgi:HEAT repeat protein